MADQPLRPFAVSVDSDLSPAQAWARVTDWQAHGAYVPLTNVTVDRTPGVVGTVFNPRTALGPVGFDDPMEIVEWEPPTDGRAGRCRLEKRGRVMLGWAEIVVAPRGDTPAAGSRTTWTEAVRPKGLPRFADGLATATSRALFGRVLRKLLA
ncbi:SRPBCC family protein [Jatrophihabitans fulvus]